MTAFNTLQDFLAADKPDEIDIRYPEILELAPAARVEFSGQVQLAVLEGKVTSQRLRDGGGYRLTRIKGAAKVGDTVDVRGKPYTVIAIEGRHLIVEPSKGLL